jgi:hypothetical protein
MRSSRAAVTRASIAGVVSRYTRPMGLPRRRGRGGHSRGPLAHRSPVRGWPRPPARWRRCAAGHGAPQVQVGQVSPGRLHCSLVDPPQVVGCSSASTFRCSSLTSLPAGSRPSAHNRYRGLHAFFKWVVAEGDLEANPMDRNEAAAAARAARRGSTAGASGSTAQDLRGPRLHQPPTPPSSCYWWTPGCAGPSAPA